MNTDPSTELLFVRLREIYGMEKQLGESLPVFSSITGDGELREFISQLTARTVDRTARLLTLFATQRVSLGLCVSEALREVISGAKMQLADVEDSSTRDLLVAAHCLGIAHDGLTACEEAAGLARMAGLSAGWELLANFYMEQQEIIGCLDRIGARLFELQVRPARRIRKVA